MLDEMGIINRYLPFMKPDQRVFITELVSKAEDYGDFVTNLVNIMCEEEETPELLPFTMRCSWVFGSFKHFFIMVSKFNNDASMLPWYQHALAFSGQITPEIAAERIRKSINMLQDDWVRFEARLLLTFVIGTTKDYSVFDLLTNLEKEIEYDDRYESFTPSIEYSRAYAFYSRHDLEKAYDCFQNAVRLSIRYEDPFVEGMALNMLSILTYSASESLELSYIASERFETLGNLLFEGIMNNNIGFYKVSLARYDEAIGHYHRAIEINQEVGNVSYNPYLNIAVLYGNLGKIEKSLEYSKKALEIGEKKNPDHPAPRLEMARALILSNRIDEAYDFLETGGELAFKSGDDRELCRYYLVRGMLEMSRGEHDSATSTLKRGLRIAEDSTQIYYILQLLLQLAGAEILALSDKDDTQITSNASLALARLEQLSHEQELAGLSVQVKLLKSEIDSLRGQKEEARKKLEEALAICEDEEISSLRSMIETKLKELEKKKTRTSLIERFKNMIRQIAVPSGQTKVTPFRVMGCIVILQGSGLEVYSEYVDPKLTSDPSLVAGLISAVSNFASNLREDTSGNLQSIVHQDIAVVLEHGLHTTCALLLDRDTYEARVLQRRFLEQFEETYSQSLERFADGVAEPLDGKPMFLSIVLKQDATS